MQKTGMHFFISGTVQGVWFRANTKEQAENLGITGWVKNLPDGRVEVLAFGSKEQLDILSRWLKKGPERAVVSDVIFEEVVWQDVPSFEQK